MAVLDDLEQVTTILGAELGEAEVIDDQDLGLGERGQQLGVGSVGARDGQFGQQSRHAPIRSAVTEAARAVGQRTSEPRLSDAGRTDDEGVEVFADPAPVADARGLSYYSDASLTARLPLDRRALLDARQALIGADLIAFEPPLYQALSLDVDTPAEPPPQRSATPRRLSEVLEQLRRPT